ncbi:MAG: PP2C family serine/threonine-protein phosphatase [Patescibacteria group bacterium]
MHIPELTYNTATDTAVFLTGQIEADGRLYDISAGTTAGRSLPDGPQKPNEDAFSVVRYDGNAIMAAVFDGASSQKPISEIEGSGARYASHALKEDFEAMPKGLEPHLALSGLNKMLGTRFQNFPSVDYADLNSLPTSTATIARINAETDRLEVSHVGDSFAAVLREDGTTELLTNNLHRQHDEEVLDLIYRIALEEGITPREARENPRIRTALMDMFQDTRNRPNGTGEGMVNGDPNMDQYIHSVSLPLTTVRAVLLASDGFVPLGMDERREEDRKILFDIACASGIAALMELTRNTENNDPDRWHVRYKHADDATGILIRQ